MPSLESMRDHEAPLVLSGLVVDGVSLCARTPLRFEVSVNPVEGLYTASGPFGVLASAGSRAELEEEVAGALGLLWRDYAISPPVGLSEEALALRQELLDSFAAL
jgi:hypothetical protein